MESVCDEVAIVRIQKTIVLLMIGIGASLMSGCANRPAYNPYPQQYPQYPQQYQSAPFPGQQLQPSPPGQQMVYPQMGQANPGYYPQQRQANSPLFFGS
jgi:hypothetical protein